MSDVYARPILSVIGMIAVSVLGVAVLGVLPVLVGAVIQNLGFTESQAGMIAAADMLGASVAALGVSAIISRVSWRRILIIGIGILTMADVLSAFTRGFQPLLAIRIIAGLGEGIMLAIANSSIGELRSPDRIFGLATAAQLAFGSLSLYAGQWLAVHDGMRGIYGSLAIMSASALGLVRYFPDAARASAPAAEHRASSGLSPTSAIGLAGLFAYFMGQGAAWAYLDQIGLADHIPASDVARALAISSIAGLLGAGLASWLDIRVGRLKPLVLSAVITLISLQVLSAPVSSVVFTLMACFFCFAWNFSGPFQFGILSVIDVSRRTISLGAAVGFAGLTLGPLFSAAIVNDLNVRAVTWLGMGMSLASALLFAKILVPIERVRAACDS
jgi:predicted MFS family arabinose efflux permease